MESSEKEQRTVRLRATRSARRPAGRAAAGGAASRALEYSKTAATSHSLCRSAVTRNFHTYICQLSRDIYIEKTTYSELSDRFREQSGLFADRWGFALAQLAYTTGTRAPKRKRRADQTELRVYELRNEYEHANAGKLQAVLVCYTTSRVHVHTVHSLGNSKVYG